MKRRNIIIGVIVSLLIITAIIIGLAVGTRKSKSNNPTSDSNPTFTTWDGQSVNLTIQTNSIYKKSLYGINYGPVNATWPECGNTLGDVIEDVKILSQLTKRQVLIRLYGMDCNMANYTILAIKYLRVDIKVIPTIWVDGNMTTYQRQHDDLFANLQQHGFDYIEGISVGNEVIFRKEVSTDDLYKRIADVRQAIRALPNVPKDLPVFTSDLGSNVGDVFTTAVDAVFANVHPYFAGVTAEEATAWSLKWFDENDVTFANKQKKPAVIAEVGWPTNGLSNKGAVASIPNLQTFISQFICEANKKQYKYYYFETFDTPWKTERFTLLEGSWGLFYPDRTLKPGLTLPDCAPTAPGIRN
ncbi:4147_t:CDS:2 [Ambispora gerdemannii]|uniref:glucan endo-1,3-beta-D-glucosidase n=1 Tax=Ambispora gerdemannii TaxID=144530 RepID=A0A9N9DK85_9GLOM|nr:4147_t:CDS:2 [Ambispora gerdemannii]